MINMFIDNAEKVMIKDGRIWFSPMTVKEFNDAIALEEENDKNKPDIRTQFVEYAKNQEAEDAGEIYDEMVDMAIKKLL